MFERLTRRTESGIAYTKIPANPSNMIDVGECDTGRIIDRLAAYEDSGLSPEEVQELKVSVKICEDCWNYALAQKEGRLVGLPCKVGDTVYFIYPGCRKVDDAKVVGFWVSGEWIQLQLSNGSTFTCWDGPEIYFGKTIFLTCEEAEKALQEGMKC
jgi:hypothetical protein